MAPVLGQGFFPCNFPSRHPGTEVLKPPGEGLGRASSTGFSQASMVVLGGDVVASYLGFSLRVSPPGKRYPAGSLIMVVVGSWQ